jgi:hypothetical protein
MQFVVVVVVIVAATLVVKLPILFLHLQINFLCFSTLFLSSRVALCGMSPCGSIASGFPLIDHMILCRVGAVEVFIIPAFNPHP